MYDLRTVAFRINLDFERSFISTGQLLRRFERDPGIDTRGTPPLIRYFTVFFFFKMLTFSDTHETHLRRACCFRHELEQLYHSIRDFSSSSTTIAASR